MKTGLTVVMKTGPPYKIHFLVGIGTKRVPDIVLRRDGVTPGLGLLCCGAVPRPAMHLCLLARDLRLRHLTSSFACTSS